MTVISIEFFANIDSTTAAAFLQMKGLHWVHTEVVRKDDPEQPSWKVIVFEEPPEVVWPVITKMLPR